MGDRYLIVSLDGGGIRGIVSSRLLERVEIARPGFLDRVDLFAGTSTGGIIALALAAGYSPGKMIELYRAHGRGVFAETRRRVSRSIDRLVRPRYDNEPLRRMLGELFGSMTLGDLPHKVLVSTFQLHAVVGATEDAGNETSRHSWKPKFFHNFAEDGSTDRDRLVVDVAMMTSAAPTFFPIYQGFVDGGIVAANPSVCAIAQALDPRTGGKDIEDLMLLSVGTGSHPKFLAIDNPNWGFAKWAPHLLPIMFEGGTGIADFQCRQLLGTRYLRIDASVPKRIGLDGVESIPLLGQAADAGSLDHVVRWLDPVFVS